MKLPPVKKDYTHLKWDISKNSPGSAGSFLKAYDNIDGKKHYYKLPSFDSQRGCYGIETFNEIAVSNIAKKLAIDHLHYKCCFGLIVVDGNKYEAYFTGSEDFCSKGQSKISLENFYGLYKKPGQTVMDLVKEMGWDMQIQKMLLLDFLVYNRDRHGANIEIIKSNGSFHMAPLFDHGLSFFAPCLQNEKDIMEYDTITDRAVNNYIGSHSLFDNLSLVSDDILGIIENVSFSKPELLEGMEGTDLPCFPTYADKLCQMINDRTDLAKELLLERKENYVKNL